MTRRTKRTPDAEPRYRQLSAVIPSEASDTAQNVVRTLGALGVLAQPLGDGRTSLTALFDTAGADRKLVDRVRRDLSMLDVPVSGNLRLVDVTGGDWAEALPEYLFPVAIGRRLLITPPWIDRLETDRIVVVIEPGGFGTGHHPTTVGCLEALETLLTRRRPRHMIDLGTGSGILAIAAARLGVKRIVAVDEDRAAITCASANAATNGVLEQVRCIVADAGEIEMDPAPVVSANLLAPIHVRLAARYPAIVTPKGSLVLGGIEESRAAEVVAAVTSSGFVIASRRTANEWTTLVCTRR